MGRVELVFMEVELLHGPVGYVTQLSVGAVLIGPRLLDVADTFEQDRLQFGIYGAVAPQ
jgi:hypothetical protein